MTRKEATRLLFNAVWNGNVDAARVAIAAGANVNVRDEERRTPLHWAADSGNIEMARLLIAAGADINARDRWNCTPSRAAAQSLSTEIVEILKASSDAHTSRIKKSRNRRGDKEIGA